MSKYEITNEPVKAIYDEESLNPGNLFLEAMPEMLDSDTFKEKISSYPLPIKDVTSLSKEVRRAHINDVYKTFIPMDFMYYIYDLVYRNMIANYLTKSTLDVIKQITNVHLGLDSSFTTSSSSASILGVPGIGKTSVLKRCLNLIPQVILHTNYKGKPIYEKQITYLYIECPADCSIKALCVSILSAIDQAISSEYAEALVRNSKEATLARLMSRVRIAILRHHVGTIVIDEIQNLVNTAAKTNRTKPLIKFLVELSNTSYTSILYTGTLSADSLFTSEDHLKRRTRGFRLLPMKASDINFHMFMSTIWEYQVLLKKTPLTPKISEAFYNNTGGNPAYILKLFTELEANAILYGTEEIRLKDITDIARRLDIYVQKKYDKGVSISDLTLGKNDYEEINSEDMETDIDEVTDKDETTDSLVDEGSDAGYGSGKTASSSPSDLITAVSEIEASSEVASYTFTAKKRGRKKAKLDENDILSYYLHSKNEEDFLEKLRKGGFLYEI